MDGNADIKRRAGRPVAAVETYTIDADRRTLRRNISFENLQSVNFFHGTRSAGVYGVSGRGPRPRTPTLSRPGRSCRGVPPRSPQARAANDEGPAKPGLRETRFRVDQKPLAFRRPLVTTLPLHEAVGVALPRIADLMPAALAPGCEDAYSAAAPVTCGVAIEVPL